ncbi:hypothetical protein PAL_GLEAN10001770 [Pteropus alecto]|uniref:Uncharacterized protein n=1 Tax=Pteropus alecto TaxID=9402 RepID=L5L747_PTEAL|nr:hypothetical protein PAL_GLEAN10001770 [Pteropus alecto]
MLQFKAFLASQPSLPSLRPTHGHGQTPGLPLVMLGQGQPLLTPELRICCACPQLLLSQDRKDDSPTAPDVE